MGSFVGDYFAFLYDDIMYDDRLASPLKRKCLRSKESKVKCYSQCMKRDLEDQKLGDGMVDEDYMTFLKQFGEYIKSRNPMLKDDNESGEDDDEFDPHYKMFLNNLKVDGKSYVLEVAVKKEVSLYIKYEPEGSSDNELEAPGIRKSRRVVDTDSLEAAKDLRMETQKNRTNVGRVYITRQAKRLISSCAKNTSICVGSEYSVLEKDMTPEPVNHVSCKENGFSSDNPSPKDSPLFEVGSEDGAEVDMVDECYQIYLDGIKGKDDGAVPVFEYATLVKQEKLDDESSCESEVLVAHNPSDFGEGNYCPFETSKLYGTSVEEDGLQYLGNPNTSNPSRFREKLMDKLRESYDHEEYNKLWQDITVQRLKERDFHFRSGVIKSCKKINEPGPSYLEQYPVLEKKIEDARFDKCKELNLLRGFFFWLQNLVQNDAFPPWLDPLCLEVTPRSSAQDTASAEPSDMQVCA